MKLFPSEEYCCNCDGCFQVCPKHAIYKQTNADGFVYPEIDSQKCIDCELCQKVCAFQHIAEANMPQGTYVAAINNKELIKKSASGGIFAIIARHILDKGGVVFGAVMEYKDGKFHIFHKGITHPEDLGKLQGSKYVQSKIGDVFIQIKNLLNEGKDVLFCGVPCQCAGLKGFLQKDYLNLHILDIICHGVPSQKMFNDYIKCEFGNLKDISAFAFRDKSSGWELKGRIDYGQGKHKYITPGTSSYYSFFLDAQIYRENCYKCKYASSNRTGDLTLGDYWGIQKEHPELIDKIDIRSGVSCIIVNTEKGAKLLKSIEKDITLYPSTYEKISKRNSQLLHPSTRGRFRDEIISLYESRGYQAVDHFYKSHYIKQRMIHTLLSILPYRVKDLLRRLKN